MPAVGLNDTVGERETKACAFGASGKEGFEDAGEGIGRDAAARVGNGNGHIVVVLQEGQGDLSGTRDGLNAIQRDVENDLLDERGVVLDEREREVRLEENLDRFGQHLLASQHDGLLDGGVDVRSVEGRRAGTSVGKQVVQDGLDVQDLTVDVAEYGAAGAVRGQVLTHDVDDSGNSGEGIADFVGQAGGELAEGGKMLGAGHLAVVQILDFLPVFFELFHHFVKLAAELPNIVDAFGECHAGIEVAIANAFDGVHELFEGTLNQYEKHGQEDETQNDGSGQGGDENPLRFVHLERVEHQHDGGNAESEHGNDGNEDFPLPADAGSPTHELRKIHACITSKRRSGSKSSRHQQDRFARVV